MKTYTVITKNQLNNMTYPVVVHGCEFSADAELELWRLGPDYKVLATIEGEHRVYADNLGETYHLHIETNQPQPLSAILGPF